MTVLFAVAMGVLCLAVPVALVRARVGGALAAAGAVGLAVVGIAAALGSTATLDLGSWLGFGASALHADRLAGIFLALTGVTGAAVALHTVEHTPGGWLTALHAAAVLFVAVAVGADNAFVFFLAWEAIAVCIYLLASADGERPGALLAGYVTGGLTKIGGAALLAAFALLYARTGSFALADWATAAPRLPTGTRDVAFVLLVIAFATKVGVVPLQGALPTGYGAAPRSGAATLSVALAAGFYGLWRFVLETLGPGRVWWGDALLITGGVTALAGVTYAITQDDLRRFLGFSTVEHTGIVLMGLGVAVLGQSAGNRTLAAAGLLAATLHVVAHGLAKTLALLDADRIERLTGQRGMDRLGGLRHGAAPTALSLGTASLTLAAVPPLGGFVSEWLTFEALLQGFRLPGLLPRLLCALAAAALALTAGLGLLAFAKLLGFSVLGPARSARAAAGERFARAGSVGVLGVLLLGLGAVAPWEVHLLGSGLAGLLGFDPAGATISHPLVLGPVFADFAVLAPTWLAIVVPVYAGLALLVVVAIRRPRARRAPVWVTGSGAPLTDVQYRPSAYANPIRVVLRGPLGYRSQVSETGGERPLLLDTRVVLAVERFLYGPASRLALSLSGRVRRLQSGRLSDYLLYMLAVLVLVLALVPILH